MEITAIIELVLVFLAVPCLAKLIGEYIYLIFQTEFIKSTPSLNKLEGLFYKICKIDTFQQNWKEYLYPLITINFLLIFMVFIGLQFQHLLPLNPRNLPGLNWSLALNISISFISTTDWQNYSGETTLSYFSQMVLLPLLQFVGGATGLSMALAFSRAIAFRGNTKDGRILGNFWVDLTRSIMFIFLPICILVAVFFISQGVIQNLSDYVEASTILGSKQLIPMGPVASHEAIKLLGDNGGGFFGLSSAHPFENPTPLTNFVQLLIAIAMPSGLCIFYGKIVGSHKHGWIIFFAMYLVLITGILINLYFESKNLNEFNGYKNLMISSGNMEGKEQRFGILGSSIYSSFSSATSGSINSIHGSFNPLSSLFIAINLLLGGVIFGGCGNGFSGMLTVIILAVFISGLMVGRTPEYLGKKIGPNEVGLLVLNQIVYQITILIGVTLVISNAIDYSNNEIYQTRIIKALYNFLSTTLNNGSSYLSLTRDFPWYQNILSIAMFIGRFMLITIILASAGLFAVKNYNYNAYNSVRTDRLIFIVILLLTIVNSALVFFPIILISSIAEYLTLT